MSAYHIVVPRFKEAWDMAPARWAYVLLKLQGEDPSTKRKKGKMKTREDKGDWWLSVAHAMMKIWAGLAGSNVLGWTLNLLSQRSSPVHCPLWPLLWLLGNSPSSDSQPHLKIPGSIRALADTICWLRFVDLDFCGDWTNMGFYRPGYHLFGCSEEADSVFGFWLLTAFMPPQSPFPLCCTSGQAD